jgi:hypothetical protein
MAPRDDEEQDENRSEHIPGHGPGPYRRIDVRTVTFHVIERTGRAPKGIGKKP